MLALFGDGLWKPKTLAAADVGADASGTAAAAIAAHLAAADAHSIYTTAAEAAAAAPVQSVALSLPSGWSTTTTNTAGSVTLTLGLPAGSSLVSASDRTGWDAAAALAGTAIQGSDPRLTDAREWSAATISQSDAEGERQRIGGRSRRNGCARPLWRGGRGSHRLSGDRWWVLLMP